MTITEKEIKINNIPAIILGNPSRNVYLYIHGQGGNKEEAYNIAEFVCGHGYQMDWTYRGLKILMLIGMAMKWLLYKIIPLLDCHIVRDMLVAII